MAKGDRVGAWGVDIAKFIQDTDRRTSDFLRLFSEEMAKEIVGTSPVDTGFFRSSWDASLNSPAYLNKSEAAHTRISGEQAFKESMARVKKSLAGVKHSDTVYLTNMVRYGIDLEFGHSRNQAPLGMIREARRKEKTIAARALKRLK